MGAEGRAPKEPESLRTKVCKWNEVLWRLVAGDWYGGLGISPEHAKRLTISQANFLIERAAKANSSGKKRGGQSSLEKAEKTDPEKLAEYRDYTAKSRDYYTGGDPTAGRVSRDEVKRLRAAAKDARGKLKG